MSKVIYRSNFSIEEHIHYIKSSIDWENSKSKEITLLGEKYKGKENNGFSLLFKEGVSKTRPKEKLEFFVESGPLKWIMERLIELEIHRNFVISVENKTLIVTDVLQNKSKRFAINDNIPETSFVLDSRFYTFFKLNKKTLTKNTFFFKTENHYGIYLKKKHKQFILLKKL